jgi:hypothetical protein
MLKSRLQKLNGLTHAELKENIINTITNIPKDKYRKEKNHDHDHEQLRNYVIREQYVNVDAIAGNNGQ